jgi:hypothetical protein
MSGNALRLLLALTDFYKGRMLSISRAVWRIRFITETSNMKNRAWVNLGVFRMRGLLGVLVAAGVMAGTSLAVTTSAEAHLFDRGGCCTVAKKVYYRQPTTTLVRKVSYERVRSYRTVWAKKLYSDRCGCRKFYRRVAVQQPTVSVVRKVTWERVRSYRTVAAVKHYRKRCCCR